EIERRAYLDAYERCNKSVTRASKALGVSKVTFYGKLRQFGMHPSEVTGELPAYRSVGRLSLEPTPSTAPTTGEYEPPPSPTLAAPPAAPDKPRPPPPPPRRAAARRWGGGGPPPIPRVRKASTMRNPMARRVLRVAFAALLVGGAIAAPAACGGQKGP